MRNKTIGRRKLLTQGRRLQPLHAEKHKVSCSGFLPKTNPMQQSCSHYNAFCSITWLTRISLRTWQPNMATTMQPLHCDLQPEIQQAHGIELRAHKQPLLAEHRGGTNYARNDRNPHTHTHTRYPSSPPAATLHGKTRFRAPASSPVTPCNSHAAITMRFAASRG